MTHQYRSFYDGAYFKENFFLNIDKRGVSLILYVNDLEVCYPLGTSRKKHKITAVYWVLGNIPSQL